MTTKKIQGTTYGFVQLRMGAYKPKVKTYSSHNDNQSLHYNIGSWMGEDEEVMLPPGNWLLLGKADELNEEQAAGIVEDANPELIDVNNIHHYKDYGSESWEHNFPTATESLQSLIQSLGMEFKLTVILKMNEI